MSMLDWWENLYGNNGRSEWGYMDAHNTQEMVSKFYV